MPKEHLNLYAVRNQQGQWFRRKGYGGTGDSWVNDFSTARIYNKIGPARAIVTFFAKQWPQYGVPNLVKLVITKVEEIDETERVKKRNLKEQQWHAKQQKKHAQDQLEFAQKQVKKTQEQLDQAQENAQKTKGK